MDFYLHDQSLLNLPYSHASCQKITVVHCILYNHPGLQTPDNDPWGHHFGFYLFSHGFLSSYSDLLMLSETDRIANNNLL